MFDISIVVSMFIFVYFFFFFQFSTVSFPITNWRSSQAIQLFALIAREIREIGSVFR